MRVLAWTCCNTGEENQENMWYVALSDPCRGIPFKGVRKIHRWSIHVEKHLFMHYSSFFFPMTVVPHHHAKQSTWTYTLQGADGWKLSLQNWIGWLNSQEKHKECEPCLTVKHIWHLISPMQTFMMFAAFMENNVYPASWKNTNFELDNLPITGGNAVILLSSIWSCTSPFISHSWGGSFSRLLLFSFSTESVSLKQVRNSTGGTTMSWLVDRSSSVRPDQRPALSGNATRRLLAKFKDWRCRSSRILGSRRFIPQPCTCKMFSETLSWLIFVFNTLLS